MRLLSDQAWGGVGAVIPHWRDEPEAFLRMLSSAQRPLSLKVSTPESASPSYAITHTYTHTHKHTHKVQHTWQLLQTVVLCLSMQCETHHVDIHTLTLMYGFYLLFNIDLSPKHALIIL